MLVVYQNMLILKNKSGSVIGVKRSVFAYTSSTIHNRLEDSSNIGSRNAGKQQDNS